MKKILLTLLVLFGLQIQTQAQILNDCDSVELVLVSSTSTEVILGTNIPSLGITYPVNYTWMYYEHIGWNSTFIPPSGGGLCATCTTDTTLNALNPTAIYSLLLLVTDSGYALNSNCGLNDTLTYNTITSQWELNSGIGNGNPTSITEIEINKVDDNRLYDLLGREFYNYNSIPVNTVYIKNRKKYLKTR